MLVLSRNVGETIYIGTDISVTAVSVKGKNVRLAIKAPNDVLIIREELAEEIDLEDAPSTG